MKGLKGLNELGGQGCGDLARAQSIKPNSVALI